MRDPIAGIPSLVLIALLFIICVPPVSATTTVIEETLMDWIDTSTSGYQNRPDGALGGTWFSGPGSEIRFKDITKHKDVNYIVVDIEGDQGHWLDDSAYMESGRHDFYYTFLGKTRPGVVYVSRSTDALGGITATHFTIFLNDWDIEDAIGTQLVYLPFYVYKSLFSDVVNPDYPDVYIASVAAESADVHGRLLPGLMSAKCKTTCVSGTYWENRLKVERSDIGYSVNLQRIIPGNPYKHASEIYLNRSDDIVYHEYGTENLVLWYPDIDTISITSPYGKTYSYQIGTPTTPEITPALYGDIINVYTGEPISGATIAATQPDIGRTVSATSDAAGHYTTAGSSIQLLADHPVTIAVTAPDYHDTSISFQSTPRYTEWYVPILMMPIEAPTPPENTTEGKTMLYGYLITAGSQQPIQGATVSLDGIGTTTTSSTGFYLFNNIDPGQHSISASAPLHDTLTESITVDATATQHNLALKGHYTLRITVKDADSLKTLTNATTISLSDGQDRNDQNPASFAVDYGTYTITCAAEGYYPTQQYQYVDKVGETPVTILITPKTAPSPPPEYPNYPPHNVKFTVQTLLGTPIPGVTVTAQGIQQTPSTNIIERLLGLNMTSTPINTELMSGTTDSNGEINFMMVEAVKYRISLYKPDVVDQTLEIYPKEDTYPIIISTAGGPLLPDAGDALRDIHINITTSTEGDIGHIHIDYNDTTRKTTGLSIQVTQQNTTDSSAPEDVIATYTVANDANVTHTFDLLDYKGQSFFVRLEAEHPDFGTINRDYAVAFKGVRVPLGPLPDGLYIYVAGFGLMLLGGIFGATSATRGVVVIAFAGWLFYAFGWLDDLGLIAPVSLGLVSTIAVMGVIVTRYKEEGYQ